MNFIKNEFYFDSVSGIAKIHAASYYPKNDKEVQAIFQITHGMAEHLERYEPFIEKLCENGFVVYINDHLGHGLSVSDESKLGYFGKENGWQNFIEDVHELTKIAKKENPNNPLFLFGHSMGSFVARNYSIKYGDELNGAVYCGTSGPMAILKVARILIKIVIALKGKMHRSKFIDKVAFGSYNKRCEGRTPFDWLSRDTDQVDKYIADPLCGFLFTSIGYLDMIDLIMSVSTESWFNNLSRSLPVLLTAGTEDPVGEYSNGVRKVYKLLKDKKQKFIDINLYLHARHEILNESEYFEQVCHDVIEWAKIYIPYQRD